MLYGRDVSIFFPIGQAKCEVEPCQARPCPWCPDLTLQRDAKKVQTIFHCFNNTSYMPQNLPKVYIEYSDDFEFLVAPLY